jgi:hypothetical protein
VALPVAGFGLASAITCSTSRSGTSSSLPTVNRSVRSPSVISRSVQAVAARVRRYVRCASCCSDSKMASAAARSLRWMASVNDSTRSETAESSAPR